MKKPLRILVVDDDHDHADSLADLFRLEGHEVEVAYSASEAIRVFLTNDFDLAFMDVVMPGMNGVESFLEIRRSKPDAKVYMMTGYSVEDLLRQATENGALGVLNKPMDPAKVAAALDEATPQGIVLVAEDDPDFGPVLVDGIACTGKSCELVTNGKDALERVEKGGVDVLVLDLKMPLINGIDVYKTLRDRGKAVPTIMVTACSDEFADKLDGLDDITVTGILTKPFDLPALLARLDRLA